MGLFRVSLSALIAREDVIQNNQPYFYVAGKNLGKELAAGLVRALQLAMVDIRKDYESAVDPLLLSLGKQRSAYNVNIAKRATLTMLSDGIFPVDMTISPSAWATMIYFHDRLLDKNAVAPGELEVKKSMKQDVYNNFANEAFQALVLHRISVGKFTRLRRVSKEALPLVVSMAGLIYLMFRVPWTAGNLSLFLVSVCAITALNVELFHPRLYRPYQREWIGIVVGTLVVLGTFVYPLITVISDPHNSRPYWFLVGIVAGVILTGPVYMISERWLDRILSVT